MTAGVVASKVREKRLKDEQLGNIDIRRLAVKTQKNVPSRRQISVRPQSVPEGGTGGNVLLYTGLALLATGLVITAVGLGERGYRSRELRMLGPGIVLTGGGLVCLRILLCLLSSCRILHRLNLWTRDWRSQADSDTLLRQVS